jgi:hypothetical protein
MVLGDRSRRTLMPLTERVRPRSPTSDFADERTGSWWLIGCDLDGAQDARQAGRVGHLQVCEIAGPNPAKIVVLLGCGVDRFPFPARDEERVHVEGGVTDRHRNG